MDQKTISPRAQLVLAERCHDVAYRCDSNEVLCEHILFAIAVDYPESCAAACRILGMSFEKLILSTLEKMGHVGGAVRPENLQIPASKGNTVIGDAMWCALQRGAEVCGLGDVFYAGILRTITSVRTRRIFEFPPARVAEVWALSEVFNEHSLIHHER